MKVTPYTARRARPLEPLKNYDDAREALRRLAEQPQHKGCTWSIDKHERVIHGTTVIRYIVASRRPGGKVIYFSTMPMPPERQLRLVR